MELNKKILSFLFVSLFSFVGISRPLLINLFHASDKTSESKIVSVEKSYSYYIYQKKHQRIILDLDNKYGFILSSHQDTPILINNDNELNSFIFSLSSQFKYLAFIARAPPIA